MHGDPHSVVTRAGAACMGLGGAGAWLWPPGRAASSPGALNALRSGLCHRCSLRAPPAPRLCAGGGLTCRARLILNPWAAPPVLCRHSHARWCYSRQLAALQEPALRRRPPHGCGPSNAAAACRSAPMPACCHPKPRALPTPALHPHVTLQPSAHAPCPRAACRLRPLHRWRWAPPAHAPAAVSPQARPHAPRLCPAPPHRPHHPRGGLPRGAGHAHRPRQRGGQDQSHRSGRRRRQRPEPHDRRRPAGEGARQPRGPPPPPPRPAPQWGNPRNRKRMCGLATPVMPAAGLARRGSRCGAGPASAGTQHARACARGRWQRRCAGHASCAAACAGRVSSSGRSTPTHRRWRSTAPPTSARSASRWVHHAPARGSHTAVLPAAARAPHQPAAWQLARHGRPACYGHRPPLDWLQVTRGLGCGGDPERGRQAAAESQESLRKMVSVGGVLCTDRGRREAGRPLAWLGLAPGQSLLLQLSQPARTAAAACRGHLQRADVGEHRGGCTASAAVRAGPPTRPPRPALHCTAGG